MIHRIDPVQDPRWPEFLQRHPKASVFHSVPWLKALESTYGYRPEVFTTSSPGEDLRNGLLFCHVQSWITGRRLVSLPFSDHCDPLCSSEELSFLIRNLPTSLTNQKLQYVEVRPKDDVFGRDSEENYFQPSTRYFLHILNLTPDLPELFRGLDKDCVQRRIRRAQSASLVQRCGRSEEILKDFFALFTITRKRHQLPPIPYGWFRNLIQYQGDALEIRVAYKGDIPISAILTLQFKQTLFYKYGCSDAEFNNFGAIPWLFWNAIVAAKSRGSTSLDLGRTDEGNLGLLAFKNHWVPQPSPLVYWRYPIHPSAVSVSGWKLRVAKRIFSILPKGILKLIGQLIYRHIG